jgi:hypothetical protein
MSALRHEQLHLALRKGLPVSLDGQLEGPTLRVVAVQENSPNKPTGNLNPESPQNDQLCH